MDNLVIIHIFFSFGSHLESTLSDACWGPHDGDGEDRLTGTQSGQLRGLRSGPNPYSERFLLNYYSGTKILSCDIVHVTRFTNILINNKSSMSEMNIYSYILCLNINTNSPFLF